MIIDGLTSRGLVGGCIDGFDATVLDCTTAESVLGTEVFVFELLVESFVGRLVETGAAELAITTPAQR
jgi:hypothetical protein